MNFFFSNTMVRMLIGFFEFKILEGFRGGPVYDVEAIADCLKRLSQLVVDFEDIQELDINPLLVFEKGKGCRIVDARIIIGRASSQSVL